MPFNEKCSHCGSILQWDECNQDFLCWNIHCPIYGVYGFPEDCYGNCEEEPLAPRASK